MKRSLTGAVVFALLTLASTTTAWAGTKVRLSTSMGNIDIELEDSKAPQSVANFLRLVDDKFYDGLIFHRVLANFVIQAGGYEPSLTYRQPPGTVPNESTNGLTNGKGTLAMARQADPDSADAQFFINVVDNPHLDAAPNKPGYTVFGKVIAGWETVVDIELTEVAMKQGLAGVPVDPVIIHAATRL